MSIAVIAALAGCSSSQRHALPYDYKDDLTRVIRDYDAGKATSDEVVEAVKVALKADRECGADLSCRRVMRLVERFKKGKITQDEFESQLKKEQAHQEEQKTVILPQTNGK